MNDTDSASFWGPTYAQHLLRHDPLHEAAYRCLKCLRALSGDRAAALRVYHTCATTLQREPGVDPSPVTHEAYERLLNVEALPGPPQAATPAASPLVGRDREWAQLDAAWRAAAGGRPHLVLLLGEAGMGKTRLARRFCQQQGYTIHHAFFLTFSFTLDSHQ